MLFTLEQPPKFDSSQLVLLYLFYILFVHSDYKESKCYLRHYKFINFKFIRLIYSL